MKAIIEIEMNNEEFQEDDGKLTVKTSYALSRIVGGFLKREVVGTVIEVGDKATLFDSNGNTVGSFMVTEG